jgi:hypothetical protein
MRQCFPTVLSMQDGIKVQLKYDQLTCGSELFHMLLQVLRFPFIPPEFLTSA